MPVVEIRSFPASEAILANNDLILDTLKTVLSTPGCQSLYYGITETSKKVVMVATWETYESYQALAASPSYPDLVATLKTAMAGPLQAIHFNSPSDPSAAMGADVVEVTVMKLKEGENKEEIVNALRIVKDAFASVEGIVGAAWGATLQSDTTWASIVGWKTLEAKTAISTQAPFNETGPKVYGATELDQNVVKFKKVVV